jgi:hypothetical protein
MYTKFHIFERVIGTASTERPLYSYIKIDNTLHADQRKNREGSEPITDDEIEQTIDAAMPQLLNGLNSNKFTVNTSAKVTQASDKVCIVNNSNNLNIVGYFVYGPLEAEMQVFFRVVTIMKVENFKTYSPKVYV